MANKFTIRVVDNTVNVNKAVHEKIRLALSLMGDTVEGYAKEDCPVDTGLLRNSITHGQGGGKPNITSYKADRPKGGVTMTGSYSTLDGESDAEYVGTNVEYAPVQEFNDMHHNVGRAHFLRDAGQKHIDELKNVAETTLKTI